MSSGPFQETRDTPTRHTPWPFQETHAAWTSIIQTLSPARLCDNHPLLRADLLVIYHTITYGSYRCLSHHVSHMGDMCAGV